MNENLYTSFVSFLAEEKLPGSFPSNESNFRRDAKNYFVQNNILWRKERENSKGQLVPKKKVLRESDILRRFKRNRD